jgi:hypothetical protein
MTPSSCADGKSHRKMELPGMTMSWPATRRPVNSGTGRGRENGARGRERRPAKHSCGWRAERAVVAALVASGDPLGSARGYVSVQAAAAVACRSCRPACCGSAPSGQPEPQPARPSWARSSTRMASRIAPSIRRSRSAGVISPRSACSRMVAQTCWSASSTVSTVITVLTSTPGIPPGMPGRGRGFGPQVARLPGSTAPGSTPSLEEPHPVPGDDGAGHEEPPLVCGFHQADPRTG